MANKIIVGGRIRDIRVSKGLSLEEFAKKFNSKRSNVVQWEEGKYLPSRGRLEAIAKLGDMTLGEILYSEDDLEACIFVKVDKESIEKLKTISKETGDNISVIVNNFINWALEYRE